MALGIDSRTNRLRWALEERMPVWYEEGYQQAFRGRDASNPRAIT